MNITNQPAPDTRPSLKNVIMTRWLNYRHKRFWVLSALLIYTLLGFFVAPIVIKNSVISLLQEDLARTTQIEKVEVNPYVLSLKILGFELHDKDDTRVAAFDEFYVNFQLSSLFRWAWTFGDVRLTEPYMLLERFDETDSRLSRMLADFANSRSLAHDAVVEIDTENSLPRLLIHDLSLTEGHMDVRDNLPGTAVETRLSPINISIQGLNTLPDRHGRQSVTIRLPGDATLKWDGSLTLAPLDSQGELVLENLQLDPAIAYLPPTLPLDLLSATLSTRFQYRLHMDDGGQTDIEVDDIQMELEEISASGLTALTEFINVPGISLSGGTLRYPEKQLQFSSLKVGSPQLAIGLNEDGAFNLADLIPATEKATTTEPVGDSSSGWQFGIDEISLEDGILMFSDTSIKPVAAVDVTELQITLAGFSNQDNVQMPFELTGNLEQGANFRLDGTLSPSPEFSMSANMHTRGVSLSLGQPYFQQYAQIEIEGGVLDSDFAIAVVDGNNVTVGGSFQIPGLETRGKHDRQRLLGWDMLDIDRFDFDLNSNSLHFSQMTLEQSFGRLIINKDQTTNLSALVSAQATDKVESEAKPLDIVIGGIQVENGSMDFSDLSLPLPFATHITDLDGSISTIDTASNTAANIKLEGRVDDYGLARIDGSMNMFDPVRYTDITVEFHNLLMSNLSPYTVQFAGREIDEGKLDLDLEYAIEGGLLHGNNNVVLSDLVLGKKVDHPDANSLPLGLAVGLLKDANGIIKIDLPVEGDINDPEFQIGGIVWQAVSGMITKLVSSPFRLLGKLIGIDSEDFGQFEFLAGRADLTPPELEKIVQLEQALQQRPELIVEISGVTDRSIDVAALQLTKLHSLTSNRLGKELQEHNDKPMMLDDEMQALLEVLFTERFPDVLVASLKTKHRAPPAAEPESKPLLDELAYRTELWNRLLASEVISDQELAQLADTRAQAIKSAFLANGMLSAERIMIAAPREVESKDGKWVMIDLNVTSN